MACASAAEIDRIDILRASLLAMQRAVEALPVAPHHVAVDGLHCPCLAVPATAIVKGDSLVAEISAASILAKTARDAEMRELHLVYPEYGFDRHKGYPTAEHLAAIRRFGITAIHRRSFGPVRRALARAESQRVRPMAV